MEFQARRVNAAESTLTQDPYWGRYLRNIERVETERNTLTMRLLRPIPHLPALLSSPELAPTKGCRWGQRDPVLGPYQYAGYDDSQKSIKFVPNAHHSDYEKRPTVQFLHRTGTSNVVDRFESGDVDITCSLMFPFDKLDEWSSSTSFHSAPAPVWMQLEFSDKGPSLLRNPEIRTLLSRAIDRSELVNALYGGASARYSALEITRYSCGLNGKADVKRDKSLRAFGLDELSMSFYDYYPNKSVAEFIAASWRNAFGLNLSLVKVPFRYPINSCADIRLELRYPSFPHPIAELEGPLAMLSRLVEKDKRRDIVNCLSIYLQDESAGSEHALDEAVKLIDEQNIVIPLVNLRHHWLMRENIVGFRFPFLGSYDFRWLRVTT